MQQNNTMPDEIRQQIKDEAKAYAKKHGRKEIGYYAFNYEAAATVWATRYQEVADENARLRKALEENRQLKERAEKLRLALVMAEFALRLSYDVTEFPADGSSNQDSAIKIANDALAAWKDALPSPSTKPIKTYNMNPVKFPGSSEVGKPKDMTDEQCFSVWATRGFHKLLEIMDEWHEKGIPPHDANIDQNINCVFYLTAWKPSYEDLQALNRGEPVFIKTIAGGLPPMMVFTFDENGQPNCD